MKKLLILLLAAPLYSSEVLFINETDEFTDEVELILAVTSDDSNTIISKVVGAYCTAGIDEPYLLFNNGGLYTIDNYRTATFRFDKNEPYEQKFRVINNQLIALGKDPVNRFLNNLEKSESFVAKIEKVQGVLRFSKYGEVDSSVKNFRTAISKLSKCNL